MEKKMSIRIRQNDFKRVIKGGKKYKSIYEQILHDYRKEEIEEGYLLNPKNNNIYYSHIGLRNKEKKAIDLENLKDNINKLFEEVKEDYKKHNKSAWQKKTKPFLTGVVTFSSEFMLDLEKSTELHKALMDFIKENFTNYLTCTLHRDEKSLHFHFSIFNYDFKTHKTIGRNINTSVLQDKIFEFLNKRNLAYGHTRGTSKQLTKAKHLEVLECKRLEIENQNNKIENQNKIIENQNNKIENQNKIIENQNKIIEDLKTTNEKLKEEQRQIKEELLVELKVICEDIIKLGEEEKGTNILQTAQKYFNKNQNERFNKLFEKATNVRSKISKNFKM